jgi:hypothetical protein
MRRFFQITATIAGFLVPAALALAPPRPTAASGAETPPIVQSPPVFATPGGHVTVVATPSGSPASVALLLGGRRTPMRPRRSGAWTAAFDAERASETYRVEASYASGRTVRSDRYRLTVLDRIARPRVVPHPDDGVRMLTLRLGRDVGVEQGPQAARVLPASFDVDEAAQRIDVLDDVDARVVSFGTDGRRTGVVPIATGSTTVNDIVRLADGSRALLDVARSEVIRWTSRGQTATRADLTGAPVDTRLIADGSDPFVITPSGVRPLFAAKRHAPEGVAVAVDRRGILLGDGTRGVRIALANVVDVAEHVVDRRGVLWAIVDVDGPTAPVTELVSIDLAHPLLAASRSIDASVFGDVTRRLVALRSGVVVMSATANDLTFTRYGEVSR